MCTLTLNTCISIYISVYIYYIYFYMLCRFVYRSSFPPPSCFILLLHIVYPDFLLLLSFFCFNPSSRIENKLIRII